MSLFEDISVIPIYQGIARIYDSAKDHTWDEQVYIGLSFQKCMTAITASATSEKDHTWDEQVYIGGLSFQKCMTAITASATSEWPRTAKVVGIIRFYHVLPNGDFCFLMEK